MGETLYDILGLPRYASLAEVKSAFKQLAVKYHPDKNPGDGHAEELFKKISAAYHVLGDEESKRTYDIRLSGMASFIPKKTKEEERAERIKKAAEHLKQKKLREEKKVRDDYARLKNGTPIWLRHSLNIFIILVGIQYVFRNYFYTQESFSPISFVFAIVLIAFGNIREQNLNYTIWLYKQQEKKAKINITRRFILNLLGGIAGSIVAGILIAHLLALYHFANYSAYTQGKVRVEYTIRRPNSVLVYYTYQVEGKQYSKNIPESEWPKIIDKEEVTVRYSYMNPVFAKMVLKEE